MKKFCVLMVVAGLLGGCTSLGTGTAGSEKQAVTLQNMITEIQSALASVSDEVAQKTNLKLGSAKLTLNTQLSKSTTGGADLWLVSGKASTANTTADKVTIILVPLERRKSMQRRYEKTLSERLAESIVAAVEGVSKAGGGKYPMAVQQMIVAMDITTTTSATAGGGIKLEVLPVALTATGSYSKSNENLLTIEFDVKK